MTSHLRDGVALPAPPPTAPSLPPLPDRERDPAGYLDGMRARVTASRLAQGLPPRITSPLALDRIAALMRLPAAASEDAPAA
ncbi:hypothetical protein CcI49_17100 [Frankia sp. CcI49]|uniref:hypothetical protein n=1 Tax=Frankia sp. CcI49 TaxID=1745382 RepID=UPI000977A10B|nr:hypothetical protein [Frankia sp. CcI49]ONH59659.1 hypothetical protein CcI49_17100 [Frankia sp. CcI49]